MKTLIKIMVVVAVLALMVVHLIYTRDYFAVGGEIAVPIGIALLLLGTTVKE